MAGRFPAKRHFVSGSGRESEWEKHPGSSDENKKSECQLLDDGRVAGFAIKWNDYDSTCQAKMYGDGIQEGDAESPQDDPVPCHRRLEQVPGLNCIDVKLGGNGQCQFGVDIDPKGLKQEWTRERALAS